VLSGEEAFSEMAGDDLLGIADGREVRPGVPLKKQVKVGRELGKESSGDFGEG
jgi:hypothetical protein